MVWFHGSIFTGSLLVYNSQDITHLRLRELGYVIRSSGPLRQVISKALWHQITTVVILRQNMRQHTESVEDAQFREALTNMWYKACTTTDIAFLRSQVSCNLPNRPSINDARFQNISIITL